MRDGMLVPGGLSRLVCLGGMSVAALLLLRIGAYGHQSNTPAVAETKALIDAGYPPLHSAAISTVELWRPNNKTVIWTRRYDGVDLETDAHCTVRGRSLGDASAAGACRRKYEYLGASKFASAERHWTAKRCERRHKI
jgi:hypothetical protein